MADFLNRFRLKTATDSRSRMSFDEQHVTTSDFFHLSPVYFRHLVPDSTFNCNAMCFSRMSPLVVPTFGRGTINLRAFFVPYSYVWRGWSDFITNSPHINSSNTNVGFASTCPIFYMDDLVDAFFNRSNIVKFTQSVPSGSDAKYDFLLTVSDHATGVEDELIPGMYKLTPVGKRAYKILQSLGYQLFPHFEGNQNMVFSALPLLCYCRVFLDWYRPADYVGSNDFYNQLEALLNRDSNSSTSLNIGGYLLDILAYCSNSFYESDYFNSAWDNPNGPNSGLYSSATVTDTSVLGNSSGYTTSSIVTNANGNSPTPVLRSNLNAVTPSNITQNILDSLKRLTQYFKRNQLAGARASERLKARFGNQLSYDEQRRSHYLGSQQIELQIGDVVSTTENSSVSLGDYAGRGVGVGNETFTCHTGADYGMFVILSSIVPRTGYSQGFDRSTMDLSRFDFWSPEFDALGSQAIAKGELFIPTDHTDTYQNGDVFQSGIFGFTPRYAHLKVSRDRLSGDFTQNARNTGLSSWHLFRQFDFVQPSEIVHSESFLNGLDYGSELPVVGNDYANSQFDRIFTLINGEFDHFYMFYQFKSTLMSPMKNLYDVFEFEDEKGKSVTLDTNGGSVN